MKGTVLFFNVARGLGFVSGEDGKSYFVHESKIRMAGFRALLHGMPVEFELGNGPDGRSQAWDVRPIGFGGFRTADVKSVNPEKGGVVPLAIKDGEPAVIGRAPNVVGETFAVYLTGGRVNGCRFVLPRYDGKTVYLVLDAEMKSPVIVDDGKYEFAPVGSYLVKAEADRDEDGDRMQVTIWTIGRRHQEAGKNLNWAVIERRFECGYDLGRPLAEQDTPTTPGLERNNDGFVPSLEVCRQFLNG